MTPTCTDCQTGVVLDGPRTQYVKANGVELAYQVLGEGPIDLVYHHGSCHVDLQWDVPPEAAFNRRLASFSRLILFDRRGTGASERSAADAVPTWLQWSEDLQAVLDAAGSERTAIFVETEAVPMGLLFAATFPDRVTSLVLGNPVARYTWAEDYLIGHAPEALEGMAEGVELSWGSSELIRALVPRSMDEYVIDRLTKVVRASATPKAAGALIKHLYLDTDMRHLLPQIRMPTLVLSTSPANALNTALHRYVADNITGSRFVEVPSDGYLLFMDDFERAVDEVVEFITGTRPPIERDSILTTLMVTDIVRSTEQAAQLGDRRWRRLLDAHDRVVRSHLVRYHGREVTHTGDGFMACFDAPARAVRCASDIVKATRAMGIDVRAGVHTGECEVRGDDFAGLTVHVAARIGTLAGSGEVLISSVVRDLVAGSDLECVDRGEHDLKGVPGQWRLFAVPG